MDSSVKKDEFDSIVQNNKVQFEMLETSIRDLADNQNAMRDAQVTRNEFQNFRASMLSVADKLSDRVETLTQEVRRSNYLNKTLQRPDIECSSSAAIGVDGPALRQEMIEMKGMQQRDEGTQSGSGAKSWVTGYKTHEDNYQECKLM